MPETDKLFPEYQLLSWLPDETFFSLVSRHHQLWGHVTSAQTCQLMFGSARAGVHHDLPNSLGVFAQRTNALLGDVDSIARERTLLNFYAAFAPPDETANAVACMSGASVAHLKLRLGILTSRFRANHPLKVVSMGGSPASGRPTTLASRLAAMYAAPANPRASPADTSAIIISGEATRCTSNGSCSRASLLGHAAV